MCEEKFSKLGIIAAPMACRMGEVEESEVGMQNVAASALCVYVFVIDRLNIYMRSFINILYAIFAD